jgi:hypothetical protein
METQDYNPTKRLKKLHRDRAVGDAPRLGLKDFAIELQTNGSTGEKKLVADWLDRKAPEPGKKKPEAPKLSVEPAKKPSGKKR